MLVMLNRLKALNALNMAHFTELNEALRLINMDEDIGAIVMTRPEMAFAGEPLALRGTVSPILMDKQKCWC